METGWKKVVLSLVLVDLALIGAYGVHVAMGGWPSITDLDQEGNLGAWWSGTKFVFAGCALAAVPLLVGDKAPAGRSLYTLFAIAFVYLSADEIVSIHEKITEANIRFDVGIPMFEGTATGRSHAAWVFVYGLAAIILCGLLQRPLRRLVASDPPSVRIVAVGMAVFVGGAVGFEVAGYYGSGLLRQGSPTQITLEEGLELIGLSIIVAGCLRHLSRMVDETRPTVRARGPAAARTYGRMPAVETDALTHVRSQ